MTKLEMLNFLIGLHSSIDQLHATTIEPKTCYVFDKQNKLLSVISQLREDIKMDGRTITLRLNGIETNRQSVQKALGYLTTWALTSYNKVLIFNTGNDFNASYTNETTGMNYFIAGIYDTDTDSYSFHS